MIPVVGDMPVVPSVDDDALGVGTTINGLTPALPISTEPNGIPVRTAPEGDGDDIAEDDDDTVPLVPQIAAVPVLLDTGIPMSVPVPMVVPVPTGAPIPVLNSLVPTPKPPPSKTLLVPVPSVAARAIAEHVLPKPGKVIGPVVAGASPGEASSVAPMGIPVGATGEPGVMPSGEVALMPGVGMPAPPTCANTGVPPNRADSIAEINTRRVMIFILISIVLRHRSGQPIDRPVQHRRSRRQLLARSRLFCLRIAAPASLLK
jgi:hypothetical protein